MSQGRKEFTCCTENLFEKLRTACVRFDHFDFRTEGLPLSDRSLPEKSNVAPKHRRQVSDPTVMPNIRSEAS